MTITLDIRSSDTQITVHHADALLAATPLADLPDRAAAVANPPAHGPALFAALGGDALLDRLDADPDQTLYLAMPTGDAAHALAWECATIDDGRLLVKEYDLLRLVPDRTAAPAGDPGALRLIALGADPLVDPNGDARDTHRLDLLAEMALLTQTLAESQRAVHGVRILPTAEALHAALGDGPRAVLHLSCHGDVRAGRRGPEPLLLLEDDSGGWAELSGDRLRPLARLADVRLIVLSSCRLGEGFAGYAGLAQALVLQRAAPATIGMQGLFLDKHSGPFAAALYRALLAGRPLGAALRAARVALPDAAAGLPVGYVAAGGDVPLAVAAGRPQTGALDLAQRVQLPPNLRAPDPFVGRNGELHALAQRLQAHKVVTVVGTGGMGKTALAAAYAVRFGLRYRDGVLGYSFANRDVDASDLRRTLLARLVGDELADQSAERQTEVLLDALRRADVLLLIDNYESVQQALEAADDPQHGAAVAVQALLAAIAKDGGRLLLTSRRQPAQLTNEVIFPGSDRLLQGVQADAAAELFYAHSPRAAERRGDPAVAQLAREVGRLTAGHPLAIALLGSAYQKGDVSAERFLAGWAAALAAAQSHALDAHHVAFAVAFDRSFGALDAGLQQRLLALSVMPFPFYANGAARLWDTFEEDDDDLTQTRAALRAFSDRSLLEVEGWYEDDTPATWRFQPAVQQELARRLGADGAAALQGRFARYAEWLANTAYGNIHKEGNAALVRLVRPALDTLAAAAEHLHGTDKGWHLQRVGWLMQAFGRTNDAHALLSAALADAQTTDDQADDVQRVTSSLAYELAALEVTRGDLNRALTYYQQISDIDNRLGNIQGTAASLHQMAGIFVTRGDLDRALDLYRQSLQLKEQIGDIQGTAASLHQMAGIFVTRGDLDRALDLYRQSLQQSEQIGDIQGTAASLHQMAGIFVTRGDLDRALDLYRQSLQLKEQIGDIKGKSSTLRWIAVILQTKGNLDEALDLLNETISLAEGLGDAGGMASSLHTMAGIFVTRGDLDRALDLYRQSLQLKEQIGDIKGVAFSLGMLGQLLAVRGDRATGRQYLERARSIYRQLGMPRETAQIEEIIAQVDGMGSGTQSSAPASPLLAELSAAVQAARAAAAQQAWSAAIERQQAAVTLARQLVAEADSAEQRDAQITLSIMLYNLADYLISDGDHAAAVTCLEEVVAIDEATGYEDLEADRQALAAARRRAAGETDEAGDEDDAAAALQQMAAQMEAQLANLPEEERRALLEQMARFAALPPEEQAAYAERMRFEQAEANLRGQLEQVVRAHIAGQLPIDERVALAGQIDRVAQQVNADESLGRRRLALVSLLRYVAAWLRGQPAALPIEYAADWQAWTTPSEE